MTLGSITTHPQALGVLSPDVVPVCCRDTHVIGYARGAECVWVHLTIPKWTPAVKKAVQVDIERLHEMLGCPVYCLGEGDINKHRKFVRMMGFVECGHTLSDMGEVPVYCRPRDGWPVKIWNN